MCGVKNRVVVRYFVKCGRGVLFCNILLVSLWCWHHLYSIFVFVFVFCTILKVPLWRWLNLYSIFVFVFVFCTILKVPLWRWHNLYSIFVFVFVFSNILLVPLALASFVFNMRQRRKKLLAYISKLTMQCGLKKSVYFCS